MHCCYTLWKKYQNLNVTLFEERAFSDIKPYIFVTLQPQSGLGCLIVEVSRLHTHTRGGTPRKSDKFNTLKHEFYVTNI
jgi:hypothetical protein